LSIAPVFWCWGTGFAEQRLSVQACRRHGDGAPPTRLDLAGYASRWAEFELAETRELIRLLEAAIDSFAADEQDIS
jgi:hypothetical protein